MPKRRRLATRAELIEVLSGREPAVDWPAVLDLLDTVGGRVELEVVADEEV